MIGVDTNVLIRHLVQDDGENAQRASRFLGARSSSDPAYLSTAVVVEVVSVLRHRYKASRGDIVQVLETMLRSSDVQIQSAASLRRALADAVDANSDLADAIIAHAAIDAGCDAIVTFDKRAQRLPGMLPVAEP